MVGLWRVVHTIRLKLPIFHFQVLQNNLLQKIIFHRSVITSSLVLLAFMACENGLLFSPSLLKKSLTSSSLPYSVSLFYILPLSGGSLLFSHSLLQESISISSPLISTYKNEASARSVIPNHRNPPRLRLISADDHTMMAWHWPLAAVPSNLFISTLSRSPDMLLPTLQHTLSQPGYLWPHAGAPLAQTRPQSTSTWSFCNIGRLKS